MALTPEQKLARAVEDTVDHGRFIPNLFGLCIAGLPATTIQSFMRGVQGAIVILATYWEDRTFSPENKQACELAYEIREAMIRHYGCFPVPLDRI